MKRIHIVGVSPRTGTTLLAEACKTCFNIDYCSDHEDRLFTRAGFDTKSFSRIHVGQKKSIITGR